MKPVIDFTWDPDAEVWIATSESVPGLVLEDESLDKLIERAKIAITEILWYNLIVNDKSAEKCRSENDFMSPTGFLVNTPTGGKRG